MIRKTRKGLRNIAVSLILAFLPLQVQGMEEQKNDGDPYPLCSIPIRSFAEGMREWSNCDYRESAFYKIDKEIRNHFDDYYNQVALMKAQCIQIINQPKDTFNFLTQKQEVNRAISCLEYLMTFEKELILMESIYWDLKTLKASAFLEIEPCFTEYFSE